MMAYDSSFEGGLLQALEITIKANGRKGVSTFIGSVRMAKAVRGGALLPGLR